MKRSSSVDRITARSLAGHATEMTLWRFVNDVALELAQLHAKGCAHGSLSLDGILVQGGHFILESSGNGGFAADDTWQLGSCIYELVTGTVPFGGRGRAAQSADSPLPVFSESRASAALSSLTVRCMAFRCEERISDGELVSISAHELEQCEKYCSDLNHLKFKKPQNMRTRLKTYDFWPEAMMGLVLLFMLSFPKPAAAQCNDEMSKLIRLTTAMRDQSNRSDVLNEMKADDKWTLMDELSVDRNECSYGDAVDMFGINDIAAEIAQREKGIVNVGGRFKNSSDGRFHYSFIELTALAGTAISYVVDGHKGLQQVAVVPFDPECEYEAVFYTDGQERVAHTVVDGISYFEVGVGKFGNYEFVISNKSGRNASFAVITYNPMQ